MNTTWLNRQHNENCILFFNGWGMDENTVSHLNADNYDICMFNNFNPISSITADLSSYVHLYLIAWSLGVWASAKTLSGSQYTFSKSIAINGTLHPIDDNRGIPESIFNGTLDNWNQINRTKFNKRIIRGIKESDELVTRLASRDVEEQKRELNNLQREILANDGQEIKFDTVLIGKQDLIFSRENQLNNWNGTTKVIEADIPHYPFNMFKNWKDLIEL